MSLGSFAVVGPLAAMLFTDTSWNSTLGCQFCLSAGVTSYCGLYGLVPY